MAKRYCISPIIGMGTTLDPYRAAVSDVADGAVALIPTDPQGQPLYGFAFCLVATSRLASVLAVTNLYALPDYSLDGRMDGMESLARAAMAQSVEAYNLDGEGLHIDTTHADSDGYRDVLTSIGQQFEPAFNLDNFDVSEA